MKSLLVLTAVIAVTSPPRVIDGDTLVFGNEHVRIVNLDAPDIGSHARCALERERGLAARGYARAVSMGERQGRDRYGRTLARVRVDGRDFGQAMIAAGHGRPWRGRSSNWCT